MMTFAVLLALRVQSPSPSDCSSNECALFVLNTTSATDGGAAKIWTLLMSSMKVALLRSTTLLEGAHGLTASSQALVLYKGSAATGPLWGCSNR